MQVVRREAPCPALSIVVLSPERGGAKLAGAEQMVAVFATIGIGQWFRYLTGALEVIGAIGLFFPRYAFYAAALLVCVMAGAVMAHLTVLGGQLSQRAPDHHGVVGFICALHLDRNFFNNHPRARRCHPRCHPPPLAYGCMLAVICILS